MKTDSHSGVDIELSSPVDNPPSRGFAPCWITIRNRSGAARTWSISGEASSSRGGGGETISASQSLRAGSGETVRALILLPLPASSGNTYSYLPHTIRVDGYGVEEPTASLPMGRWVSSNRTAYIGMGDALATTLWTPLFKDYESRKITLAGSPVQPTLLSSDWRALSGLDGLWLTDAEYASLDAGQRVAVQNWVVRGGQFSLCARSLDPALRAGLGLPAAGDEAYPGFGSVRVIAWDGKTLAQETIIARIDELGGRHQDASEAESTNWAMRGNVGTIPINAPFLIGFIGLFAAVVGPYNLFWLAGSSRRHRLFWTTPLISVAASLLLLGAIVVQDGFGGRGERSMVALLLPERKQAVIVQEQLSRTGVLASRHFTVAEDVILSALKEGNTAGKSYEEAGRDYAGDWFASRSLQAQRVEAIVPSRAEIQVLNAGEARAGAPPVVTSSIPAALKEIYYLDAQQRGWRGGSLRTGERITLQRDQGDPPRYATEGGAAVTGLLETVHSRPGYFIALAEDGPFVDTLQSIHWNKQRAVFLGPVNAGP